MSSSNPETLLNPEYIFIRGEIHNVAHLLNRCAPVELKSPKHASEHHEFELVPPYSEWPKGFAKFTQGIRIQHKRCHGVVLTRTLLLAPKWHQPSRCGLLPEDLPFVAMRYIIHPHEHLRFYWKVWFEDDEAVEHILKKSPPGKWLAKGYHNENNLLSTQGHHRVHRIQTDTA